MKMVMNCIIGIYRFFWGIFVSVLNLFNQIVPKKKRWFFYFDSIRDNSKYLMEYAAAHSPDEVICFFNRGKDDHDRIKEGKVRYTRSPVALLYYYLTSRIVVTSFDFRLRIRYSKDQHVIQLWHGYALKTIGDDSSLPPAQRRGYYYSDILCYNEIWKDKLAAAFGCEETQLHLWDNPRNDLLFQPMPSAAVKEMLGADYGQLILWLPTYRKSRKLHNLSDSSVDIPIITPDNISAIDRCLADAKKVLVVKPHPLQNDLSKLIHGCSNIFLLNNADIEKSGYEFYQFLAAADALITDYSSVYFDYLITDKPIGFAFDDFDEYKQKRGFLFDDPKQLMPGLIIDTEEKFCEFLRNTGRYDEVYRQKRKDIRKIISRWTDSNNCKRVFEAISALSGKTEQHEK